MKNLLRAWEATVIGIVLFSAVVIIMTKWILMPFTDLAYFLSGNVLALSGFILYTAFIAVATLFFAKTYRLLNQGNQNQNRNFGPQHGNQPRS